MPSEEKRVIVTVLSDDKKTEAESPITGKIKIVIIINNQFTDSPNTTQIASGAGRSSAAGSNAAIDSSNTLQQQSVGAGGEATNTGMEGEQVEPHETHACIGDEEEIVIVINNQINKSGQQEQAAATQVASGGGTFSAAGTNSAIESSNTKQQHAVGGGKDSSASNDGMNDEQHEA